tara:strand:+ start:491 stop:781 length:291 start_codon:yes stop_codon:yes gene_type:complete
MSIKSPESYIQQLASYIKRNLAKGYTLDSLKIALQQQEYSKASIDKAIEIVNEQLANQAPIMEEKPKIRYKVVDENNAKKEIKLQKKKSFLEKLFG